MQGQLHPHLMKIEILLGTLLTLSSGLWAAGTTESQSSTIKSSTIKSKTVNSAIPSSQADPAWLAFGDLRGYVEPCGCDPATDKGGIQRIYYAIQQERLARPDLWVFSTGNYPDPLHPDPAKIKAFDAFAKLLKPTATLFNALELKRYGSTAAAGAKDVPAAPMNYVLSNIKTPLPTNVERWRAAGDLAVYGYVSPDFDAAGTRKLQAVSADLIESWRVSLKQKPAKHVVLLFAGHPTELKPLVQAQLFTDIILSNSADFKTQPDASEFNEPTLLRWAIGNRHLLQVPLGGQGLVRGGVLQRERAPALDELFKVKRDCQPPNGLALPGVADTCIPSAKQATSRKEAVASVFAQPIDWLGQEWQTKGPMIEPLQHYKNAKSGQYEEFVQSRLADQSKSEYVGSATCQSCHAEAYKIWKGSQHSQAFQTLVDKQSDRNADCVTCHVAGLKEKGGFIDATHTPHLKDVGCEQCHGPRLAHINDPAKNHKPIADKTKLCESCHHAPHTPQFSFNDFWQKIKH